MRATLDYSQGVHLTCWVRGRSPSRGAFSKWQNKCPTLLRGPKPHNQKELTVGVQEPLFKRGSLENPVCRILLFLCLLGPYPYCIGAWTLRQSLTALILRSGETVAGEDSRQLVQRRLIGHAFCIRRLASCSPKPETLNPKP